MDVDGPFDELLLRVGRLNYAWTNTESLLIHLIAGLSRTDKETAVIIFLTLNTTRARIDLVERLAKLDRTPDQEKKAVLKITKGVASFSALRNRYSHSIYALDPDTGETRTIMMRIADRKDDLRMGRHDAIDAGSLEEIDAAVASLSALNQDIWALIKTYNYPS